MIVNAPNEARENEIIAGNVSFTVLQEVRPLSMVKQENVSVLEIVVLMLLLKVLEIMVLSI